MTNEEIRYRLQAMATMCTFQDAVGHDLSHEEIGLYNEAKDEAIDIIKRYEKQKQALQDLKKEMEEIITNKQSFIYHLVIDTIERKIREVEKK